MKKSHLALFVAALAAGMTLGQHEPASGKPKLVVVSEREISEKVDGKPVKATTVEVTFEPGQASMPHRHPGPVFGTSLRANTNGRSTISPPRNSKPATPFTNQPCACTASRGTSAIRTGHGFWPCCWRRATPRRFRFRNRRRSDNRI